MSKTVDANFSGHNIVERRGVERRGTDRRKWDRRRGPCTAREQQVLALLLRGMANKQIAQILGIAEDTVKKHLLRAYRKIGVHRRALLIIGVAAPPALMGSTTTVE